MISQGFETLWFCLPHLVKQQNNNKDMTPLSSSCTHSGDDSEAIGSVSISPQPPGISIPSLHNLQGWLGIETGDLLTYQPVPLFVNLGQTIHKSDGDSSVLGIGSL